MINYGRQDVRQDDIDAVVDVLRSDFLTGGSAVPRFEEQIAFRTGAARSVAVNSATSALHIACLALDLGPGDLLWTVPNTFVASANAARYCGADVDFVDIDADTWNMSTSQLEAKLVVAARKNRLPKIVLPVHFAGQPTDQEAIWDLAQQYGFRVLEDASHAVGASRHGEPAGSTRWSDIAIFSFHPVKIITTGEGGMALTDKAALADRMRALRNHGIVRNASDLENESPGPWYYEQQMLGFNYRITDIQAALGSSQLGRIDEYVARRNALADRYHEALSGLPLRLPFVRSENISAYHLYMIRLRLDEMTKTHREVFEELRENGIGANLHYTPVHLQPYYRALGFGEGQFPEAEAYGNDAITIPLFPRLTDDQQDQVVGILEKILAEQ